MSDGRVFTISELTRQIKLILESNLTTLWVEGELSDFTWHPSGHMYFSLKDKSALLRCVMWKSQNQHLLFRPKDGMQVQAQGRITLYERGGQYQLAITQMLLMGRGDLRIAFERLAEKLRTEGLFRQELKKPLPRFPLSIGVVTSPAGAAIEDISGVIWRRFPPAQILFRPASVQGEGAAEQIARAIEELNLEGRAEVIIVGRGGGSPEDLWAFNEERVARAIYASRIPVVSAVGHEIDVTISDLVADVRAPTPSAAGEMVVPHHREVMALLGTFQNRMAKAIETITGAQRSRLATLGQSYGMRRCDDLIEQKRQLMDQLGQRFRRGCRGILGRHAEKLNSLTEQLTALDPRAVLSRGYSVCRRLSNLEVIRDARQLHPAEAVEVSFARGKIEGTVDRVCAAGLREVSRGGKDG